MAVWQIESLALVQHAIDAVKNVHGGYQAIDLLTKAMSTVEEPDDFEEEVREAEAVSGMKYEGPNDATRALLKTVETAAHESTQKKSALVDLTALVLLRLGSIHGAKVLVGLLAVAGVKPALGAIMVRVLLVLLQSEDGRRIVMDAWPQIQTYLGQLWQHSELRGQLQDVAARTGEEGSRWLGKLADSPQQVLNTAKSFGESIVGGLNDLFIAQPVKPQKPTQED